MERKKTKNWIFDRAATLIVVAAMIVSLLALVPGSPIKVVEAKADAVMMDSSEPVAQVTEPALKVATGSAFSFVATPGKTTRVRIFTSGFDSTYSEGIDQFVSFGLDVSDKNIVASDLTMSGNGIYSSAGYNIYPDPKSGDKDNYPFYYFSDTTMTIDFNVSCSELLPKGEHAITLYGTTLLKDDYTSGWSKSDKLRSYKVPLATFILKNTVSPKEAKLYIDSVTYNKSKLVPSGSSEFSVKIKNIGAADASEVYIVAEMGTMLSPDYEMQKLRVGSLKAGETKTYKVPFTVN